MNQETEILYDVAVLGEQIDQFFKSDIGKYLLEQAAAQELEGLNELRRADCNKPEAVWNAQKKVWIAENFRVWLNNALLAGLKARMIIEDRED